MTVGSFEEAAVIFFRDSYQNQRIENCSMRFFRSRRKIETSKSGMEVAFNNVFSNDTIFSLSADTLNNKILQRLVIHNYL
mmetsp:Transcript_19306/g.41994  ORF Transcript_19306/g.41994 Transcript_19306/m.41994 type:complete len:80 (+) Transcript_19306:578-817(+)